MRNLRLNSGLIVTGIALAALTSGAATAQAQIITQWNFNSTVSDTDTTTGVTTPSTGAGSLALVGGTTSLFASGDSNGGSSDPATGDDSGLGVTNFPAATVGSGTAGIQFNVSTAGFSNISLNFDVRPSNSSSRFMSVLYTTDGSTFLSAPNGVFTNPAGDTWYNVRTVNFTGVAGVANNPNFAVRVVSIFDPANNTSYTASSGGAYAGTGNFRFDQVTVSSVAVPEPGTLALVGFAGLPLAGVAIRRRKSK